MSAHIKNACAQKRGGKLFYLQLEFFAYSGPKDPAVLKILRRSNLLCVVIYYGTVIYYGDPLVRTSFSPGITGIPPLKEGFGA